MKMEPMPPAEQVNILAVDSSSDDDDAGPESKRIRTAAANIRQQAAAAASSNIHQQAEESISEDVLLRKAQMYQEYMKLIPIPSHRGSVVSFTSWTGLGTSLKQLYGQPLHYLTNVHLRQLDRLRHGAEDEDTPLHAIISPLKAEASIWLIEEVHRLSASPLHLAKIWLNDPLYHVSIDPIFPELKKLSL